MSRYKKFLAALLAVTLLFSLVGCGNEQKKIADTYQSTAQEFIDEGNIAAAIKVLEDGIEATHDKELIAMLAKLETGTNEPSSESNDDETSLEENNDFDISSYRGDWSNEDLTYDYGGNVLNVDVENETLLLDFQAVGPAPMCRIARFTGEVKLSEMKDNTCSISFDEDGWGNHGVLSLEFGTDGIAYTISEVPENYEAMWGVYNMEGVLFENPDAWNILTDSGSDNTDYNDDYYEEPTYDTSKASGILASLGLTEDEFKASCGNLNHWYRATFCGTEVNDLITYPNEYVGKFYTHYDHISTDGNEHTYGCFIIGEKGSTSDGITYYINDSTSNRMIVFDKRDDIHNPTLSENHMIRPYMIFTGVKTIWGKDYACFDLISADLS